MTPHSLRRLLLAGTAAFALVATALLVGSLVLFGSLRRSLEREATERLTEQRAGDEIVTSVYGQILASYRQLQTPSNSNMQRFDSLGRIAYDRLRQYLFQSMSVESRLQVESIKELHQILEVEAHGSFDLIARGEPARARARVAGMQHLAEDLQSAVARFMVLRERERALANERQLSLFGRWLAAIALFATALVIATMVFARMVQRQVVRPLGELADAAVRLGQGDLTARIAPQRYEELATVATRFNAMVLAVEEARTEIEARNAELRETIQNLNRAQQDLVQQEKLGAIGFMLAGLAHELNNPLAGILGMAEIIDEELARHPDARLRELRGEVTQPLIREAGRAGALVRNLLQFSRQSGTSIQAVRLKQAVDVSAGLRAFAFTQHGKDLRLDVPEDLFVAMEPQRLEHVIMNIMSNALDAVSGDAGTGLTVCARRIDADWVSLRFEDDGPGFRDPSRVFDAFYTTKAVGTGTGLGLSLAQRFVTEAGGSIAAENVPGRGARLTLRLPAATPATEAQAALREESERAVAPLGLAPVAGGEQRTAVTTETRVLVVDDEPAIRDIQRRFLAGIGISATMAKDGAEAITILEREHFDAVVTDLRMPGVDGFQLFEWIAARNPDLATRCLFVTGELRAEVGGVLAQLEDRVITKPFTRDEYLARVFEILEPRHQSS